MIYEILRFVMTFKIIRVGAQLMKIRSEESTSKPPDISALEEDIERAEEELSEMEINLAKLKHKFSEAKEVFRGFVLLKLTEP